MVERRSRPLLHLKIERSDSRARVVVLKQAGQNKSLAPRADPEKLQGVSDGLEAVARGDLLLELPGEAFLDFHDGGTPRANQMMMVSIVALRQQLEPRRPIPQIKPFDHPHALQQVQATIDGGEIAIPLRHCGENLLAGHGMRVSAENIENGLARAGDFAGFAA
jgi:hypothetical protein